MSASVTQKESVAAGSRVGLVQRSKVVPRIPQNRASVCIPSLRISRFPIGEKCDAQAEGRQGFFLYPDRRLKASVDTVRKIIFR